MICNASVANSGAALARHDVADALGGAAGVGGGLAYTALADTSGFEGYSGFVVAYWMLGGIILGAIAGAVMLARRG